MTFYEAALRILESEGRPLHFLEITEKSISQNLLSHVGKTPEITMLSRLAAMARRTRDRKVVVTARDTFALVDWSIPEDAEALAQTGVPEPNPEEELPPLRPTERHPEPRTDNVRVAGRGSERKRRREDEEGGERGGRKRRFPPLPEVVFEILSEGEASLRTAELIERAKGKELAPEDVTVEAVLTALLEDNQRRIDAGRRPQFSFNKESGEVTLERAGAPSEAPPLELQAAFAQALGIPLEGGRPVLGRPAAAAGAEALLDPALLLSARTAVKEARRAVARGLRKRLGDAEVGTFEKSVVKMMHGLGFRELKVAKRSKEGPLLTARKREGSVELRYAVRLLKGNPAIDRKMVQELRRDLGHYASQVGLVVSAGDVRGDARSEAQASGALVMLWCGDALGEKFLEAQAGVTVTQVELFDLDERFFEVAKLEAEEAQKRREERQKEKREGGEEGEESSEKTASAEKTGERPPRKDREARREEREARRAARRQEREAREQSAAGEASPASSEGGAEARETEVAPEIETEAEVGEAREAAPPPLAASADEQGEDDEEGDDDDLEAASEFVGNGARPEGGAEGAPGERKRRRRRRRGRRGRGRAGAEGAAAQPGGAPAEGGAPSTAAPAEGAAAPAEGIAASTESATPFAEAAPPPPVGGESPAPAPAPSEEPRAAGATEPAEQAPAEPPSAPPPPPESSGSSEGGQA